MHPSFESYLKPVHAGAALWRLILGIFVITAVYLAGALGGVSAYVYFGGAPIDLTVPGRTAEEVLLLLVSFGPLILGIWLAAVMVHRRDLSSLMGEGWAEDFLRATLLLGLLYGGFLGLSHMSGLRTLPNMPLGAWLAILPLAIAATLIQTLAEEILFRGYLMQQLAARFTARWIWFAIPSLLFGAAHTEPDLYGNAWIYPVLAATLFGVIAADLTTRSGNLGHAWGLHFATNTLALTVIATGPAMTGLALRLSPHQVQDLADAPWMLIGDLSPLIIAWIVLRRRAP